MKRIKTIELEGVVYAVPAGMTDAQLASVSGLMLQLQRVDYCCDRDYNKTFHYLDGDCARVRIGAREVHPDQASAHAARDAHNATLPEKQETA